MKQSQLIPILVVVAIVAVCGTLARGNFGGDGDEDAVRDAIEEAAAAVGIENVEVVSVTVEGSRAVADFTFTKNGDTSRFMVTLEKLDGGWTTDLTPLQR